ncbi:MAG TPA: zinc-binding dehydrogenase [Verrucomicrobiales bacterium]|nr:zinc-binding dehydrogenase [Verrucomicrobiae bacterium]MCP5553058.1 zinc-binding dehydrogenase [Akkermansiaceae bacterium]HRX54448.1 zinc-binding dehydrogenase [Verrucomicrobiales bacterium]
MRAAVYKGKEVLDVEEVADPALDDGEVLLRIHACSVCGTDLRTYRHGDKKIIPPRILGHEFCATVVESRAPDANVTVGDRVVMYIVIVSERDRYVEMGRENLTAHRTTMSYHHDGAFAPLMKVPALAVRQGNLFKVTSDIPNDQMSLAEPLGCCMNAHSRLGIGLKDTVAVIGAGPIGIMHACLARLQGAQKVFVLDNNPARLEMAKRFDIDGVALVREDGGHRDEIREWTDGFGADVVITAVSAAAAQNDALEIAAKAGRVNFFAGLPKSNPIAPLDVNQIHYKELVVSGSYSEKKSDFQAAFALLHSGRFPADRIITHHLPLDRVTEAFPLMESGEALKVCIEPASR